MLIQILGRVAVLHGGVMVTVSRAQARGVLALLALNVGRVVSLDTLVASMWGGAEPATARTQIHSAVSSIRRLLATIDGTFAVVGGRFGYQLAVDAADVDALQFERAVRRRADDHAHPASAAERLREALGLWHGDPLADATGAFVEATRAQLTSRRLAALDDLATLDLSADRCTEVVAELAPIVADHPGYERLRGRLMIALSRCGRAAEALRLYHDYRRELAHEDGLDPGAELTAVAEAILRDQVPGVAPHTEQEQISVAAYGTPNLLPPAVPDFVGRRAELAIMSACLHRPSTSIAPTIVTITGMGGVGKSTLAVLGAQRALDGYPHGCLYADLRGSGERPADPHIVTGTFLRVMGVDPDLVPADPHERLALYRSVTAVRRLLLVLDDVHDEQQLRPLIPTGGGCAVIATARASLAAIDGATPVRLTVLCDQDAVRLLSTVGGIAPSTAATIARMCGGLPLALRIAGARLAAQTDVDPAILGRNLADLRLRLSELSVGDRNVRGTLAVSHRRLSTPAAELFGLLAALPVAQTPGWVATCLPGASPPVVAGAVTELVEAALVIAMPAGDECRYQLHHLVQLYGREQPITPAVKQEWLQRVYQSLANLIVDHDELHHLGYPTQARNERWFRACDVGPIHDDPIAWFTTERHFIAQAIDDAFERGWTRLALQLLTSATNLADMSDAPQEWETAAGRLLPLVVDRDDLAFEVAMLLLAQGGRLRMRGEMHAALTLLRRARVLFHRMDDPARAATSATEMAIAYRRIGHTGAATQLFGWAITRFAVAGHPPHEAQAHIGLGNLHLTAGRLGQARHAYTQALAVVRRHPDKTASLHPNIMGCLAEVLSLEGHHRPALDRYHDAMAQAAALGDRKQWAQLQFQVARVHQRSGDPVAAAGSGRRAAQALDHVGLATLAARAREIATEAERTTEVAARVGHEVGRP